MLFFFCLSQFLQYFPLLSARWADSEQGGREKAAEKERMERERAGREEERLFWSL